MAIIKCKMCGGDLVIEPGSTVAECEYCGRRQTVPTADNEKKLTLFARANRLRSGCEFDKAAGVYESIVADFPEEAEAYWGLVLCKYGIEYVDDPATGKKIPTCHRSSFDSILEDSDFDQACENADTVAQKVYREEAKEFERIRKGILEVSSTEKPYDIFICYKETDEKGERTLDSVLAQDLYSALTGKGYRVFFSRVTLRDKLGQAYEPYIFAALNSAKVMLAVGTCYEYYNAVWVKNEWSRYLKLMAADKSKHLIPCYKDLDPEDMPREFKHLQGADLGKMGAIQDILFNMEKYIPLKKQTLVQERVVVENAGAASKIASLLDRGYMALEDGDWQKADGFFEEVLNNDSKNAQAYIGKALVKERQKTLDGLVRQWLQSTESAKPETLTLKPEEVHIEQAAKKYAIEGYLEPDDIRKAYHFDLSYPSTVSVRQQQYQKAKTQWENHQWLSKAEKFAAGQAKQTLEQGKKTLFDTLDQRLSNAKSKEKADRKAVEQRYREFLAETDKKIQALYRQKLAQKEADDRQREECYQELVSKLETAKTIEALGQLAEDFRKLGSYRDSAAHAKTCEKRRDALLAREAAKRRKRSIRIAACLVLIVAAVNVVKYIVIPALDYQNAVKLMEQGEYEEAIVAFTAMGDYRDSAEQIQACEIGILDREYNAAAALMAQGSYEEAITAFAALNGHRDSAAQIQACETAIQDVRYDAAVALMEEGSYEEAITAFTALNGHRDSEEQIQADLTRVLKR
ncbi:MAG: TIR domain-containing protein, partial [Clostridiales bacterium]|nr:TIR domain-containing protein [Clostridiales bacterium]